MALVSSLVSELPSLTPPRVASLCPPWAALCLVVDFKRDWPAAPVVLIRSLPSAEDVGVLLMVIFQLPGETFAAACSPVRSPQAARPHATQSASLAFPETLLSTWTSSPSTR